MGNPCQAAATLLPDASPAPVAGKPMPFRPAEPVVPTAHEERRPAVASTGRAPRFSFRAL